MRAAERVEDVLVEPEGCEDDDLRLVLCLDSLELGEHLRAEDEGSCVLEERLAGDVLLASVRRIIRVDEDIRFDEGLHVRGGRSQRSYSSSRVQFRPPGPLEALDRSASAKISRSVSRASR